MHFGEGHAIGIVAVAILLVIGNFLTDSPSKFISDSSPSHCCTPLAYICIRIPGAGQDSLLEMQLDGASSYQLSLGLLAYFRNATNEVKLNKTLRLKT